MKVRGFAEFMFSDSAKLAFARVCEHLDVDVSTAHPNAWVIDERRISFALEARLTPHEVDDLKRTLSELSRSARQGEAYLDSDGKPRWMVTATPPQSGVPDPRNRVSAPLEKLNDGHDEDQEPTAVRRAKKPVA